MDSLKQDDQAQPQELIHQESRQSFSEVVAQRIIAQLEAGTAPWQKPWKAGDVSHCLPMNPTTGKRYKGINALHLACQGRNDPRWMTYRQASEAGAQVRKGEKGTPVQYWKFSEEREKLDEQGISSRETVPLERPRVFFATVFNAEQIDGLPPLSQQVPSRLSWEAIEQAEHILKTSGARIEHQAGNRAFYDLRADRITLPDKGQFELANRYYATALHELGHWSGHESRLNRDLIHPFGSEGYAREELRAEIASMILGDELGIGHDPGQHVAYVGAWIKALREDPLEIFRAASDAEKIRAHVMAFAVQQDQSLSAKASTPSIDVETVSVPSAVSNPQEVDMHASTVATSPKDTHQPLGRTYLSVPFSEKDEAKALGARWDRAEQSWYVPPGLEMSAFQKWTSEATEAKEGRSVGLTASEGQVLTGGGPVSAKEKESRVYLAVPYAEREVAKSAGAQWDRVVKSWYAGPNADLDRLQRWLPDQGSTQQLPAMTPREEFAEALKTLGCVVTAEHPIMDGKKHRIPVEGDKAGEQAGFYVVHLDGLPAGYIKNNRTGLDMKWKSKGYSLSEEEKARLSAEAANKANQRADDIAQAQASASERVVAQMAELVPIQDSTPYLRNKEIGIHQGAFTDREGQTTYLPVIDVEGKQWSMQYIKEDGTKRFAKDSRKEGCFHAVGGLEAVAAAPVLIVAEGYATAASIAEASGQATVAAFDSGNLLPVVKALHGKYPTKPVIIFGDDDRHLELTQGINPGRFKALAAASAVGGKAIFPIFAPLETNYPADLPPITPASYRAHLSAKEQLQKVFDGSIQIATEAKTLLESSLLTDRQLEALQRMKSYTDFNDLATISILGHQAVQRQVCAHLLRDKEVQAVKSVKIETIRVVATGNLSNKEHLVLKV